MNEEEQQHWWDSAEQAYYDIRENNEEEFEEDLYEMGVEDIKDHAEDNQTLEEKAIEWENKKEAESAINKAENSLTKKTEPRHPFQKTALIQTVWRNKKGE